MSLPAFNLRACPQPSPEGWHLYLIPYPQPMPLAEPQRTVLVSFIASLLPGVRDLFPAHNLSGFMQYNQLNLGGASHVLSTNAPVWGIDAGLGYWPEREPPTLWTVEDFTNLDVGEMPRPMMHQIFGVTNGDGAVMDAVRKILGLGPVILTLSEDAVEKVKARAREQFFPLIQEPTLKMFGYYYPLLCAATFAAANQPRLAGWTCGIKFYLRESPEEKGIFIASTRPLSPALERAGARQDPQGNWEHS